RYGVVEGRFCFEGGSHCGKGEGLHMLITDQAQDITDSFDLAAQGTFLYREHRCHEKVLSYNKTIDACHCERPPVRPPKPAHMEQKKPIAPPPPQSCSCMNDNHVVNNPKVGPYENYDVPKVSHVEVDNSEYYDTPKRIKQALAEDLFQVTKTSTPDNLVLKKNCGCILKFGSRKKPVIVECDENLQPVECPCQKVTNWANNLISLPYCKRNEINVEVTTNVKDDTALYATVDVSRKTNRQSAVTDKDPQESTSDPQFINYQNITPKDEKEGEDHYEYYENAKDLLRKAGVTQSELDALSANLDIAVTTLPKKKLCTKCGHTQLGQNQDAKKNKSDEYLLMEPANDAKQEYCKAIGPNPGYTPMSPNPNWSLSLKHPMHKVHRVEIEKSLSIPTLNGSDRSHALGINNETLQKRSSSVDSARLLEDLKEFDSSIGSHATSSSLETLRNLAIENRRSSSPCENDRECYECCKSSGSENKTEESLSKETPHLRNKHMDNAQIKRSSSVPCKGGNRDSSSSNDSGVSSCSLKHGVGEFNEFEMPLTSGQSRYHYMMQKRMRGNLSGCVHSSLPRKSKSSDPLRDLSMQVHKTNVPAKSSSAEAEVPVLPPKQFKGVMDTHSTSSGTSDMSDYIETLSLTSSHSSSDTPMGLRMSRQPTNTLRPRSGKEYHNIDPIITSMYKNGKDLANYSNIP
ncbi:uncharacterized protein LOC115446220, partial [Manduca sexta]|uniref:uncharacterized protein LOC115446220 n=1 Tax=Manduca sexta TaxID=7130 RepID=UPI00188FE810